MAGGLGRRVHGLECLYQPQNEGDSPCDGNADDAATTSRTGAACGRDEKAWRAAGRGALFQGSGQRYSPPKLVLFSGAVESACGFAEAAMGPFYCPADQKLYLDMGFFNDLAQRHDATGDFAQAYVVAHAGGHHVQTLLGIAEKVQRLKSQVDERRGNELQIRLE